MRNQNMRSQRNSDDTLVILEGIFHKNQFFTSLNRDPQTQRYTNDGKLAYNILGYAKTIEEAQIALYGRAFT